MTDTQQWHVTSKVNGNLTNAELIILNWHYDDKWADFDITKINNSEDNILVSELSDLLKSDRNPIWIDNLKRALIRGVRKEITSVFIKERHITEVSEVKADPIEIDWSRNFLNGCKREIKRLKDKDISLVEDYEIENDLGKSFKKSLDIEILRLLSQIDINKYKIGDFRNPLVKKLSDFLEIDRQNLKLPYYFNYYFWSLLDIGSDKSALESFNSLYKSQVEPGDPVILNKISQAAICTVDVYVDYKEINSITIKDMLSSVSASPEIKKILEGVIERVASGHTTVVADSYVIIWRKLLLKRYTELDDSDDAERIYHTEIENHIYAENRPRYGLKRENLHLVAISEGQYSKFENVFR